LNRPATFTTDHGSGGGLGLVLGGIVGRNADWPTPGYRSGSLLQNVGELVGQELVAGLGCRRKSVGAEHNVGADGVRVCVHIGRRTCRVSIVVDANVAEVRVEEFLHVPT
jgi:hypothetical protein